MGCLNETFQPLIKHMGVDLRCRNIGMTEQELDTAKIRKPVRFAFISDVHIGSNPPRHLQRICDRLGVLEYDGLLR